MTSPPDPRVQRTIRGVFAATLTLEALVVLLVPRTISQFGDGLTGVKLTLLLVLAGLFIVAAGMLSRPWGVHFGTALQVALLACGFLTTAMFVLGAVFGLIWFYELRLRDDLLGRS